MRREEDGQSWLRSGDDAPSSQTLTSRQNGLTDGNMINLPAFIDRVERRIILRTLKMTDGNRAEAAKSLGLGRTTLVEKIRRMKIEMPSAADNRFKTHCYNGHELSPENVYLVGKNKTQRRCIACRKNWVANRKLQNEIQQTI